MQPSKTHLDFGHVSDEFQDLYVQMYDTWAQLSKQGKAKSAGVITMKDYASIANQIVSARKCST